MMEFKCVVSHEQHKKIVEQVKKIVAELDLDEADAFIYAHELIELAYREATERCTMK
ncbi:hypothetical protein QJS83_14910 [Bdellovibrio sp. 22V]|uniref:hypothetical protein n=1 Tax=Bdellovibrio sp. 22V TaxID=3044166 RepID=UPI0025436C68|nr:hypothetical protein [Bdellovibrio sp. 22V]WII71753.1 hypothetical protein QJS83_14910 [Bdellovibrio sp. 22V]